MSPHLQVDVRNNDNASLLVLNPNWMRDSNHISVAVNNTKVGQRDKEVSGAKAEVAQLQATLEVCICSC